MVHLGRLHAIAARSVRIRPVPGQEPELISIAAAQTEFGVGRSTLYRLIDTGQLTAHKRAAGRPRVFVDRREVRKLLEPKPSRKRR